MLYQIFDCVLTIRLSNRFRGYTANVALTEIGINISPGEGAQLFAFNRTEKSFTGGIHISLGCSDYKLAKKIVLAQPAEGFIGKLVEGDAVKTGPPNEVNKFSRKFIAPERTKCVLQCH